MDTKTTEETQSRQYTLVKQNIGDILHAGFQYFEDIKAEQTAEQFRSRLSSIRHPGLCIGINLH